jgi:hypothetical protein
MALLDTASLIVTPNGYKASKLYSIVPSDGTGDMTFSRTGNTATRVNSSGVIETVNANIPRLDYLDGTCPKLLLEPQRTNLILQSQDISSASWSKPSSPVVVTNVAIAPDGTTTADSIQSTDTSGFKSIKQTNSFTANSTFTFSFFVKKETSRTNYGGVGFSITGGTTKSVFVIFDETNGTQINLSNSTLTPTLKTETFGNYYRFSITITDNGSNTTVTTEIYSTLSVNGTSFGIGIGSARTIWGSQLELGSFATSYIATTTATVTRNVDSGSKIAISSLIGSTEGTIFCQLQALANYSDFSRISISDATQNNKISIGYSSTNTIQAVLSVAGSVIVNFNTSGISITNNNKIAFKYKLNSFTLFVNGVSIATLSSGAIFSASTLTNIYFTDGNGSSFPIYGKLSSLALWKTALSDSECVTLTTL